MNYQRANFDPIRRSIYGVGLHWTTWTMPRTGKPLPFNEAVAQFDVAAFVQQVVESGAGHVLFMANHALHWLPGPNPEVDRILPGRTCERDLIMEVADALRTHQIPMGLYYNHGVYHPPNNPEGYQDPQWQKAVGSLETDRSRYYDNYCNVLAWMGEHYGEKVISYWFDGGYEHARFEDTPWDRFAAAAKAGNANRLITYNSGIAELESYTPYQDYWAGELVDLTFEPGGDCTPSGFPWYTFLTWHKAPGGWGLWGLDADTITQEWPSPPTEEVEALLRRFQKVGGAVTFNLFCYQDGSFLESDLGVLRELLETVR